MWLSAIVNYRKYHEDNNTGVLLLLSNLVKPHKMALFLYLGLCFFVGKFKKWCQFWCQWCQKKLQKNEKNT